MITVNTSCIVVDDEQGSTEKVAIDFNGETIVGVVSRPTTDCTAVALILHGCPDGTKEGIDNFYIRISDAIVNAGIATARFDFLGAGESSGEYVATSSAHQVEQYLAMVTWLRESDFRHIATVGDSFGGTCALGGHEVSGVDVIAFKRPGSLA